jgi:hypothetical protein
MHPVEAAAGAALGAEKDPSTAFVVRFANDNFAEADKII